MILSKNRLSAVLQRFFKSGSVESFKKQLNLYGFARIKQSKHIKYRHPLFHRYGAEDLWRISKRSITQKTESYSFSDSELEELEAEVDVFHKVETEIKQLEEENKVLRQRMEKEDAIYKSLQARLDHFDDRFINKRTADLTGIMNRYQKEFSNSDGELLFFSADRINLLKQMVDEVDQMTSEAEISSDVGCKKVKLSRTSDTCLTKKTNASQSSFKIPSKHKQSRFFMECSNNLSCNDLYLDPHHCNLSVCHDVLDEEYPC